jgi:hypothetical protein
LNFNSPIQPQAGFAGQISDSWGVANQPEFATIRDSNRH